MALAGCGSDSNPGAGSSGSSSGASPGGQSSSGGASNQLPVADAGADQVVLVNSTVMLAGSGTDSDGAVASYVWVQNAGQNIVLSNAFAANTGFTAPAQAGVLTFQLTVTDTAGAMASDSVTVTVNAPPNQLPTANAGADQSVSVQSPVTLSGSGMDSDGAIASYAWMQLSGANVTLTNADMATATFTSPATAGVLTFRLTITDDDNATAMDDVTITVTAAPPSTVNVSGRLTFDKVPFGAPQGGLDYTSVTQAPIRGAVVEALDGANQVTVLATADTNANGDYVLTVPADTSVIVQAQARMRRTGTPGWDFRVVDNTNSNALYVLRGTAFNSGTVDITRNLNAASGWGGTAYTSARSAAPFSVLDATYDAYTTVLGADPNVVFQPLDLHWSINNVPASGSNALGQIGTSHYENAGIFILGAADNDTDEYDQHVLVHEWGHYFEAVLSRADSIGGAHGGGDRLDMRVAFGEGWGNALSGMVKGDPMYRDSLGAGQAQGFVINNEQNAVTNPGWYSESSVQSILYDIFDADADGVDSVSLGFAPIYNVLVGAQSDTQVMTSIFSFAAALRNENPAAVAGIDALLTGQSITATDIDAVGSTETNDAGNADVLPVYTPLQVGGGAVTVCSSATFGVFNKLSNRRFLIIGSLLGGNTTITATGPAGSDPGMALFQGQLIAAADASGGPTEILTRNLNTGSYVLEVYEFSNLGGNPRGRTCFDVTLNQ